MRLYNITHNRIIQQHEISVGRNGVYIPIAFVCRRDKVFIKAFHNSAAQSPGTKDAGCRRVIGL